MRFIVLFFVLGGFAYCGQASILSRLQAGAHQAIDVIRGIAEKKKCEDTVDKALKQWADVKTTLESNYQTAQDENKEAVDAIAAARQSGIDKTEEARIEIEKLAEGVQEIPADVQNVMHKLLDGAEFINKFGEMKAQLEATFQSEITSKVEESRNNIQDNVEQLKKLREQCGKQGSNKVDQEVASIQSQLQKEKEFAYNVALKSSEINQQALQNLQKLGEYAQVQFSNAYQYIVQGLKKASESSPQERQFNCPLISALQARRQQALAAQQAAIAAQQAAIRARQAAAADKKKCEDSVDKALKEWADVQTTLETNYQQAQDENKEAVDTIAAARQAGIDKTEEARKEIEKLAADVQEIPADVQNVMHKLLDGAEFINKFGEMKAQLEATFQSEITSKVEESRKNIQDNVAQLKKLREQCGKQGSNKVDKEVTNIQTELEKEKEFADNVATKSSDINQQALQNLQKLGEYAQVQFSNAYQYIVQGLKKASQNSVQE